ncbi:hypothetical protein [Erwinia amylovora]|uniref:hypothetical protein n=1 Tax=Erwinia amylovora TaxID=552 RepID=UPI0002CB34F3|nr:hypothetical protein [Erwinia amylovora]CCP07755.1 hypothetical protein BN440_2741 [Erwinia amylovora MR1]
MYSLIVINFVSIIHFSSFYSWHMRVATGIPACRYVARSSGVARQPEAAVGHLYSLNPTAGPALYVAGGALPIAAARI